MKDEVISEEDNVNNIDIRLKDAIKEDIEWALY